MSPRASCAALEQHKQQKKRETVNARALEVKTNLKDMLQRLTDGVLTEITDINASAEGAPWQLVRCTSQENSNRASVAYTYQEKTSTFGSWVLNGLTKSTAVDTGMPLP